MKLHENLSNVTPYKEINAILLNIVHRLKEILGDNLIGVYLFGSLSYGDFNPGSSDIDLMVIVKNPIKKEIEKIKSLHREIEAENSKWQNRLECSYTPVDFLKNVLPPKEPRVYYNEAVFYEEALYGNEWIINIHLLYKYGITLMGPDFKELTNPVEISDVQKACIKDLFQEWVPKINDFDLPDDSHYQSYIILNLCRILYTVLCGITGTKKASSTWVKNKFNKWTHLIDAVMQWEYGKKMPLRNETILFIKFVVARIKETELYKQINL